MLGFVLIFGISACELPDNVDPKEASEVPAETLFTNGMVALFNQVDDVNVNRNTTRLIVQYWQQTTYFDESRYLFQDRKIPDNYAGRFYRNSLMDLQEAKRILEDPEYGGDPDIRDNMIAILEICSVYGWHCVVDAFGNMPYTEALKGAENTTPAYDDAATIYDDILDRLDNALGQLDGGFAGFGAADIFYNDDIALWKKFGATLMFRMGMRLVDHDAGLSSTTIDKALAYGVFESQAESAMLNYNGVVPHVNAIYNAYEVDGRADYLPTNTIVDMMNNSADPRLMTYFVPIEFTYDTDDDGVKIDTEIPGEGKIVLYYADETVHVDLPFTALQADTGNIFSYHIGAIAGLDGAQSYNNYSNFSDQFFDAQLPAIISDYVEVLFLMAEKAARAGDHATAATYYNDAVTESIVYWGGTADEATTYLAMEGIAYDEGNWKMSIGTQKWLALYNRGIEGWAEWRRLDYPELNAAENMELSDIPNRLPYPYDEIAQNGDNYYSALNDMGIAVPETENYNIKLFWDKN